jgi:hypothetical protein
MQHVMILSLMASRLPVAAEQQGRIHEEKPSVPYKKE